MSYIGNSPGVASQRVETTFTATASQTVFTPSSGYTLGYCDVYYNGVKLVNGDDYTASDGVSITLATAAAAGDSVVVVASFPRGLTDGYLKAEADAKYVALTGDQTVAGIKTFSGSATIVNGNLGVGTSSVLGNSTFNAALGIAVRNQSTSMGYFQSYNANAGSNLKTWRWGGDASGNLVFETVNDAYSSATNRLTVSPAGHFALAVTPSTWDTSIKAIEAPAGGVYSYNPGTGNYDIGVYSGSYFDGAWRYKYNNTGANAYYQTTTPSGGRHTWYIAPSSGASGAGTAISWVTGMTLDNSNVLTVGASAAGRIVVNGTGSSNIGVLGITATDTVATFVWAQQAYLSGMTAGQNFINMIGKSGSTKNAGYIGYRWAANSSDSNLLTFGHYGSDNLFNIDGAGNALVGTLTKTPAGISNGATITVLKEVFSGGNGNGGFFFENRSGTVTSNSNWYGWYATSATIYMYNPASGNIASINTSSGAYTALSDRNKKKDFEDSTIGLAAVMQLKPTLFRMLDDEEDTPKQLGFLAQDVEPIIPQAYVEQHVTDAGGNDTAYIGLNDRPIVAALTKAIQEQQAIIEQLRADVQALKEAT